METQGAKTERDRQAIYDLMQQTPFARALGLTLVKSEKGVAELKIPYREELVGNPETGVIHGGVVTSLLDHTLGYAVFSALEVLGPIATLDMRIDYMRAAEPHREIFARAQVKKLTASVAFVTGTAYHVTPDDPIATSTAAFMLAPGSGKDGGADG
jgi:uncharacterized protein (TIGR00369 family)